MSDQKVLNLDELFGQDRPVVVMWQGKRHEFMRMAAIGPREALRFEKMMGRAQQLSQVSDPSADESAEIEGIYDEMIGTLCPDFPIQDLKFLQKLFVVDFYVENSQGELKKVAGGLKTIGGKFTAS